MKLMTHIVAGYPSLKESEQIALTMSECGASYIEIQFPFSDPIADGATILEANQKAIEGGTGTEKSFQLLEKLAQQIQTPLLIMTYYNIAHAYGLEKFCKRASTAGCYGLIIPDLPIDEEPHDHYLAICKKHELHAIQVISPLTPDRRLKILAKKASGFVYCVATYGTTGERAQVNKKIAQYLAKVRKHIELPLALGFGISSPDQAKEAAQNAEIVVIGSKIINIYKLEKKSKLDAVKKFLKLALS